MIQLQSTKYITETKDSEMIRKENIIKNLRLKPVYPQHSKAWFDERNKCITATKISTALDEDPYEHPIGLLLDKCFVGKPFEKNKFTHHGNMMEQIGNMCHSYRNNVRIGEHGIYRHDKYRWIGASPDGICDVESFDGTKFSKLVGRLIEIKFPYCRKILSSGEIDGGICPHQYYVQIMTQLFVTGFTECDFIQLKARIFTSDKEDMNEMLQDLCEKYSKELHPVHPGISEKNGLEMGMMIELIPLKHFNSNESDDIKRFDAEYEYQPRLYMTLQELIEWYSYYIDNFESNGKSSTHYIKGPVFWKLDFVKTILIEYEPNYIEDRLPVITQFWKYVKFYRKKENSEILKNLKEYAESVGYENSADIFRKVHEDFKKRYPKTKTAPLYQQKSEWRRKFDEKYSR